MDIHIIVLEALEKITGIGTDELEENKELNLLESGILDSLSTISLLAEISAHTGRDISIQQMKVSDFSTVSSIILAIERV